MTQERLSLGREGEQLAGEYLKRLGYRIVEKNFKTRLGEIDLIAKDSKTLVFVEVKTRSSNSHGFPLEAVTKKKQRQLARVAMEYLGKNKAIDSPARFDVVAVLLAPAGPIIEVVKNAFDLPRENRHGF